MLIGRPQNLIASPIRLNRLVADSLWLTRVRGCIKLIDQVDKIMGTDISIRYPAKMTNFVHVQSSQSLYSSGKQAVLSAHLAATLSLVFRSTDPPSLPYIADYSPNDQSYQVNHLYGGRHLVPPSPPAFSEHF